MAQWGKITLWDAAADGDLAACKKRMEASWTKIDAKDAQGKAAIHEAARWGHADIVAFLLDSGASRDITTVGGTMAIHLAAANGRDNVLKLLVQRGASINALDGNSDTPLMCAAAKGQLNTVNLILSMGADKSLKNLSNKTALDQASNADVAEVLREEKHMSFTKY